MADKILVAMMGLPRSGKTTEALKLPYPIVSPDAIRYALHGLRYEPLAEPWVWAMAKTMVRALFLAGHQIVTLDATNVTRLRRDEWRDPEWDVLFYEVPTATYHCLARAKLLGDDYILTVIERMAAKYEPLQPDERAFSTQPAPATVLP